MSSEDHKPHHALVTGGAGFIGCNLVRHLLESDPSIRVINYDALTYAGSRFNLEGLKEQYGKRYVFVEQNICDGAAVAQTLREHEIDTIFHLAAETHVDRSITGPSAFLQTNVLGTFTLLDAARHFWGSRRDVRFHHVSTDEIYGSLGAEGYFVETSPYNPSSPYSASKAASDHLVRAWNRTYGLPVTISNCSNNYGPYQFPEKLIPLMIFNALAGKPLPVYGTGGNVRDWLHVEDHCQALDTIVRRGEVGRTYNIGGGNEWTNLEIVRYLCDLLQELRPPKSGHYADLIMFVQDRPGHDLRYAIDASRIRGELKWQPRHDFRSGLEQTVQWYLDHAEWLSRIAMEKYQGQRLGIVTASSGAAIHIQKSTERLV